MLRRTSILVGVLGAIVLGVAFVQLRGSDGSEVAQAGATSAGGRDEPESGA